MKAKEWREQFEVLTSEAEAYLEAHAKVPHDIEECNGLHGNEWSCRRFAEALLLCRQVLAKHPR